MDKLLWQALTNLLSIVMTQTSFIVEHAQSGDEDAVAAVRHRTGMFRSIGNELLRLADNFEAEASGSPTESLDALYSDFSQFLEDASEG